MAYVILGEIIFLFLLSRVLTREISFLFFKITHSKVWAIRLFATIFLLGTVIHEFSHAIVAEVLFVRARHMILFPEFEGKGVKLGSVEVEKTDFVRNFFISLAPFFVGTALIVSSIWLIVSSTIPQNIFSITLIGYLVFTVSNTMFSSKKDLQGAIEFIILSLVIVLALYFLGVRFSFSNETQLRINETLRQISLFLAVPIGIDIIIILLSKSLNRRA